MRNKFSACATKYAALCVRRPQRTALSRAEPKGLPLLVGGCLLRRLLYRFGWSSFGSVDFCWTLCKCIVDMHSPHTCTHSHTHAWVCMWPGRQKRTHMGIFRWLHLLRFLFFVASLLKCSHKKTYQIFFSSRVKLNGAKELQIKHSPEYI